MPKGVYDRRGLGFRHGTYVGRGPWENPETMPFEEVPDLSRGAIRFAAEVAVAELTGANVPDLVHQRAIETLLVMAKG